MSVVTTVMLSVGTGEYGAVAHVNKCLRLRHQSNPNCPEIAYSYVNLRPITGNLPEEMDPTQTADVALALWGGTKNPQADIWCGAYNSLDLEEFLGFVVSALWENPEWVQVFVKREEDATFGVYAIRDNRIVSVLAPVWL